MSEAVEKKEINIKEDNMEIKLTKDQRAVANAAAKETTRPVLHCVHIKKGLIEATDGFILVQKKIDYDGEEEVLLDIDEFKRLKDNKPLGGVILTSSTEENKVKALGQDNFILKKRSSLLEKRKLSCGKSQEHSLIQNLSSPKENQSSR